ncbi:predicted protein [Enterococcus faecalis JH1]|nr:predicted protein [Enterococcus faecalis ATCC 4200]EEU73618.1 predicted protein [Enterococcus faecalis JH1]EEU89041.1 predicted protein [Enterococcus faecalis ARO1/DG]
MSTNGESRLSISEAFSSFILKGANETHKTNQSIFSTIGKENLHKKEDAPCKK